MKNYLKLVHVDQECITPIYKQVANAIIDGVKTGQIVENDVLPSLYDFHIALDISINSVKKAYDLLKKDGIVGSVPGKGYYIASTGPPAGLRTNNDTIN